VTYRRGETVRIADRPHDGHHRTPGYLKGKRGMIARVHATFTNPETRAYGDDGQPRVRLYLVEFDQRELWPDRAESSGHLYADVFEHWLEPAS
jgi:nitrile hydratase subunit beta